MEGGRQPDSQPTEGARIWEQTGDAKPQVDLGLYYSDLCTRGAALLNHVPHISVRGATLRIAGCIAQQRSTVGQKPNRARPPPCLVSRQEGIARCMMLTGNVQDLGVVY